MTETDAVTDFSELSWREYLLELGGRLGISESVKPDADYLPNDLKNSDGSPRVIADHGHFTYEERFFQFSTDSEPEHAAIIEMTCIRKNEELLDEEVLQINSFVDDLNWEDPRNTFDEVYDEEPPEPGSRRWKIEAETQEMRGRADEIADARETGGQIINSLAGDVLLPAGFVFAEPSKEYPHGFFYKKNVGEAPSYEARDVTDLLWKTVNLYGALDITKKIDLGYVFWDDKLNGKGPKNFAWVERNGALRLWQRELQRQSMSESDAAREIFAESKKIRKELEERKDSLPWREYLSELSNERLRVKLEKIKRAHESQILQTRGVHHWQRYLSELKPDDWLQNVDCLRRNGIEKNAPSGELSIIDQKNSDGKSRVIWNRGYFVTEERFSQLFPGAAPEYFTVFEIKRDGLQERNRGADEERRDELWDIAQAENADELDDEFIELDQKIFRNRAEPLSKEAAEIANSLAGDVLLPAGFVFAEPSKEYPQGFFYKKYANLASQAFDAEFNDALKRAWYAVDSFAALPHRDRVKVEQAFLKQKELEKKKEADRGFAVSEWHSRKTGKTFDNIDFPERAPTDEETEFLLSEGFRKGWRDGGKTYFSKASSERREELAETIGRLEKISRGRDDKFIEKDADMSNEKLEDEIPFDGYETKDAASARSPNGFSVGSFQHWNFMNGQSGKMLDMVSFSSQADTDAMTAFMSQKGYKKSHQATQKHPFGTFYAEYDEEKSAELEGELKSLRAETSVKSVSSSENAPAPSAGNKGVFAEWSYRNYNFISFVGENGAENTEAEAELMKSRGYVRAVGKDGAFKTTPKNPNGWYFSNMKTKEDELRRDGLISELARGGYSREAVQNKREASSQKTAAESAEPEPENPEKDIKVETWEFSGKTGKFCCAAVASEEVTKSVTDFMTNSENGFRYSEKTSEQAPNGYFYRSVNTPEREAEAWGTIADLRDMVPEVQKSIEKENARKSAEQASSKQAAARPQAEAAKTNSDEKGNKTMSFDYQEYTDGDGKRWGNIYLHGKASDAVTKRFKSLGLVDRGTNSRGNHQFGKIIEQDYQQAQMQEALAYLNAYQRPEGIGMPESPVLGGAEPESRDASGRPAASATIQNFYSETQKRSYLNVYFDKDPGAEAKQAMANCGLTFNGKTRPRWWSRDVADTPELRESVDKALGELGIARQYKLTAAGDKTSEISASKTGGVKFNHEITVLENGSNASFFVFSERPGAAVTSQLKEAGYTFVAARTARDGSFVPSCWHKSGVGKETAEGLEKKFSQTMAKASGADVSKMQETSRAAEKQQVQQRKNGRGR